MWYVISQRPGSLGRFAILSWIKQMLTGICRYYLTPARWSARGRNGRWLENICTVCGGIKHRDCFLLTYFIPPTELPSQSYTSLKRPPMYSSWQNSPFHPQSLDIKGKKLLKMMKCHRNKVSDTTEELAKMWLRFYLQCFQSYLSTKDVPKE